MIGLSARHPLLVIGLGLGLGLCWPLVCFAHTAQCAVVALLAVALALVLVRARLPGLGMGAAALAAAAIGALSALPLARPMAPDSVGVVAARFAGPATVWGVVAGPPIASPGSCRMVVRVSEVRSRGARGPAVGLVAVTVRGLPTDGVPVVPWDVGDRLQLDGRLSAPRDLATPGTSSRTEWLARRGLRSTLQVKSPRHVLDRDAARRGPLTRVRSWIVTAIDTHVAGGRRPSAEDPGFVVAPFSRAGAVVRALLVYDRGGLDPEDRRDLAEAGLMHVLAISGLHVGLVAMMVYAVLTLVTDREPARVAATLIAVWLYVGVAGVPGPALRAGVMTSVLLFGRCLYREAGTIDALLGAFVVGCLLEPGGIRDAGFQLTYAAAAGLLLIGPTLRLRSWWPGWVWGGLSTSVAAQLAVLPILAVHFGRLPLLSPILNVVAVPLTAVTLVGGFATCLLSGVAPFLADHAGSGLRWLVDVLFECAEPRASWTLRVANAAATTGLVCAAGLGLAFAVPGKWRRIRWPLVGLVIATLAWPVARPPRPAGLRLTAIDVGQGDALLAELADGRTVLVDAGGHPQSAFDVGDRIVLPFLLARGVRSLDVLAITHAHPDHGAGALALLRELDVGELWIGDDPPDDRLIGELRRVAAERGVAVVAARRGVRRGDGLSRIVTVHPTDGLTSPVRVDNDRSLVIEIGAGEAGALLTGDIEAGAERTLLAGDRLAPMALLKLPHHGSATSTTPGLLARVQPRLALASCGFGNRFEHPAPTVVERLARARVPLLRTDLDGTVTVELSPGGTVRLVTARARFSALPPPGLCGVPGRPCPEPACGSFGSRRNPDNMY